MDLHVSLAGRGDLTARIYRQLREAIVDGRLRPGERLPPTRELAQRLDVARNTVGAAYDRLTAEGFLVGRVGAGTFVRDEPVTHTPRAPRRGAPGGAVYPRRLWRALPVPPPTGPAGPPPPYDFGVGVPDATLFPLEAWRRLVAAELHRSTLLTAGYADPAGHAGLRAAIARYIGVARSVRATADDVLVTHGAQQAFDLVGRVLIEPGDRVAVEEPGYPPVRRLFQSLGARVVGVPVDGEGLVVEALPRAAKLVYVTPSHQFPLGVPMSLARRTALLGWAAQHGAVVLEDDYDSEFRYGNRPLDPLQSLDRGGRVVYIGSFSKTLLPALRIGFLVAPASLRPALRTARQLTDWHGETPTQAALARLIDDGLLARHIRKASRDYAGRHERIVGALGRDFADWLELVPSAAGLHLCALRAPESTVDLAEVVRRAQAPGVAVQELADFCAIPPGRPGLVVGFGAIAADRIGPGLARLAATFRSVA